MQILTFSLIYTTVVRAAAYMYMHIIYNRIHHWVLGSFILCTQRQILRIRNYNNMARCGTITFCVRVFAFELNFSLSRSGRVNGISSLQTSDCFRHTEPILDGVFFLVILFFGPMELDG